MTTAHPPIQPPSHPPPPTTATDRSVLLADARRRAARARQAAFRLAWVRLAGFMRRLGRRLAAAPAPNRPPLAHRKAH